MSQVLRETHCPYSDNKPATPHNLLGSRICGPNERTHTRFPGSFNKGQQAKPSLERLFILVCHAGTCRSAATDSSCTLLSLSHLPCLSHTSLLVTGDVRVMAFKMFAPYDLRPTILITAFTLTGVSTLVVAGRSVSRRTQNYYSCLQVLRLYCRISVVGRLKLYDYIMLIALLLTWGLCVCNHYQLMFGSGAQGTPSMPPVRRPYNPTTWTPR